MDGGPAASTQFDTPASIAQISKLVARILYKSRKNRQVLVCVNILDCHQHVKSLTNRYVPRKTRTTQLMNENSSVTVDVEDLTGGTSGRKCLHPSQGEDDRHSFRWDDRRLPANSGHPRVAISRMRPETHPQFCLHRTVLVVFASKSHKIITVR